MTPNEATPTVERTSEGLELPNEPGYWFRGERMYWIRRFPSNCLWARMPDPYAWGGPQFTYKVTVGASTFPRGGWRKAVAEQPASEKIEASIKASAKEMLLAIQRGGSVHYAFTHAICGHEAASGMQSAFGSLARNRQITESDCEAWLHKNMRHFSQPASAERAEVEPKLTIKQDGKFWEVHQDWRIERNLHLRTFATREAAEDFIANHADQRQPAGGLKQTLTDDDRNDLRDSLASLADPRPSIPVEKSSLAAGGLKQTLMQESAGTMTDEKALQIVRMGLDWLNRRLKEGNACNCGDCYLCAFEHLRKRLAVPAAAPAEASEVERLVAAIPLWARQERCAVCGGQAVEKFSEPSEPSDPRRHPPTKYMCAVHLRSASERLARQVWQLRSERSELQKHLLQLIADTCEEDAAIRKLASEIIGSERAYGDLDCIPGIFEIVETIVAQLRSERSAAKQDLDIARACKPDEFTHVLASERAARESQGNAERERNNLKAMQDRAIIHLRKVIGTEPSMCLDTMAELAAHKFIELSEARAELARLRGEG